MRFPIGILTAILLAIAMHPSRYNLLIPQGTDYALSLYLTQGPDIRTSGAKVGATTIPLSSPLSTALVTGNKVSFDRKVATLTANAAIGTSSLSVSAIPFELGRQAGNQVLDLTGYSATAELWSDLEADAIATLTTDLSTAPSDGLLVLPLANAVTATLPATHIGSLTEAQLQSITEKGPHYDWQLKLVDAAGLILRPIEGFAVVSREGA